MQEASQICVKFSVVSPTVFREGGFRFFFFSREEARKHVHVQHSDGEAKYWLEPKIELAQNQGLSNNLLSKALKLVEEHHDDISHCWNQHFGTSGR